MKTHPIFCITIACASFILVSSLPQSYMAALPDGCTCPIVGEDDPVCGNNGMTYPNLFALRCSDECVPYSIHLMHHGPCVPDGDRWHLMSSPPKQSSRSRS